MAAAQEYFPWKVEVLVHLQSFWKGKGWELLLIFLESKAAAGSACLYTSITPF